MAAKVPTKALYTGATIPAIGLGTFGSDNYSAQVVARAVEGAIEVGYRQIDCASVYRNEKEIGGVFRRAIKNRDEFWITSKVWNDRHGDVAASCEDSLRDLGLGYLDLYLVHWPIPNHHGPGVSVDSRDPHARPYIHDEFMGTWRQMEALVRRGLVRHIGTSNMTIPKLELVLRDAEIKPAANEMELHPHFQQPELFAYVVEKGIVPIGYCPIGSPGRPERDRTPEDTTPTQDPVILEIAAGHGVSPAEVCIKWAVQRGQAAIPFSINHYRENLECVTGDPLSDDEMRAVAAIDRKCRFIKGQVFLWKEGQSWEALWDINGEITPP